MGWTHLRGGVSRRGIAQGQGRGERIEEEAKKEASEDKGGKDCQVSLDAGGGL